MSSSTSSLMACQNNCHKLFRYLLLFSVENWNRNCDCVSSPLEFSYSLTLRLKASHVLIALCTFCLPGPDLMTIISRCKCNSFSLLLFYILWQEAWPHQLGLDSLTTSQSRIFQISIIVIIHIHLMHVNKCNKLNSFLAK